MEGCTLGLGEDVIIPRRSIFLGLVLYPYIIMQLNAKNIVISAASELSSIIQIL